MNDAEQSPAEFSIEEISERLGIEGLKEEDLPVIQRFVQTWSSQVDLGGLNKDTADSILHALRVREIGLLPTLKMKKQDPTQYGILEREHRLAMAEYTIASDVFRQKGIIDVVEIPKALPLMPTSLPGTK